MKKIRFGIVSFIGSIICINAQYFGKVGINTNTPEKELSIKGTMKTSGMFLKDPFEKLGATENYSFLIKSPVPENKITAYNDSFVPNSPSPINLIQFKIGCDPGSKDWIKEYDTKISSDKFLVVISSFGFTQPIKTLAADWLTPVSQIYAYYSGGTWKLKADYHGFAPDASFPSGIWTLNLMVFDRAYAKEFNRTFDVGGAAIASSPTPLIQ